MIDLPPLPPRPTEANKSTMGRVLIIGGSPGLSGAVILAARAALRSGAGLVTAAVPHSIALPFDVACLEGMSLSLPEDQNGAATAAGFALLEPLLDRADAVVLGPGLGRFPATEPLFAQVLDRYTGPLVIDADGLWHLARDRARLEEPKGPRVLTPHDGEFSTLRDAAGVDAAGVEAAERDRESLAFARVIPGVLVRKGPQSRIVEGNRIATNPTGNPGLATGGSGDVLAGVIGALLGRGDSGFVAARRGTWLHGRAGDRVRDRLGVESMIASDVIDELPGAFLDLAVEIERPEIERPEIERPEIRPSSS